MRQQEKILKDLAARYDLRKAYVSFTKGVYYLFEEQVISVVSQMTDIKIQDAFNLPDTIKHEKTNKGH